MSSPSHTDLREELDALARTQTFSPDPSAWDRGRRARRNSRVARSAAALAVVALVVGIGTIVVRPDRDTPQPAGEVRGGAIPSRVQAPEGPTVTHLDFGRAAMAYVDDLGQPFLVSATTGETRPVELPDFPELPMDDMRARFRGPWLALSADGDSIAYPVGTSIERNRGVASFSIGFYRVVDLTTGATELVDVPPGTGMPLAISWTADGQIAIDVFGRPTAETTASNPPDVVTWTIDPSTGASGTAPLTGVIAPGLGTSATYPTAREAVDAVPFETATGTDPVTELPRDRYPDGAVVHPIGWADSSLLVAQVGSDLVLLTSPDRPESEWIWRTLVEDVPEGAVASIAVDLVPDLTGDPDQELTHDFSVTPVGSSEGGRTPIVLGGVLALLAGIAFVRMMQKRA